MEGLFTFSGMKFFSIYGLIALLLAFIPNLVFAKKTHQAKLDDVETCGFAVCVMEMIFRLLMVGAMLFLYLIHIYQAADLCMDLLREYHAKNQMSQGMQKEELKSRLPHKMKTENRKIIEIFPEIPPDFGRRTAENLLTLFPGRGKIFDDCVVFS